jgi:predicted transcriptional regulator
MAKTLTIELSDEVAKILQTQSEKLKISPDAIIAQALLKKYLAEAADLDVIARSGSRSLSKDNHCYGST